MRTFKMIFKADVERLNQMLEFRRQGWTYESLAIIYGVDHSSIYSWCKKMSIPRPKTPVSLDISEIINVLQIRAPKEKNYTDYLEDEHRRRSPKIYALIH